MGKIVSTYAQISGIDDDEEVDFKFYRTMLETSFDDRRLGIVR